MIRDCSYARAATSVKAAAALPQETVLLGKRERGSSRDPWTLIIGRPGRAETLIIGPHGIVQTLIIGPHGMVLTLIIGPQGRPQTLIIGPQGRAQTLIIGLRGTAQTLIIGLHGTVVTGTIDFREVVVIRSPQETAGELLILTFSSVRVAMTNRTTLDGTTRRIMLNLVGESM